MRAVFIGDAHLHLPSDRNYQALLVFLEELRGNTDLLVILGDLFDFWIGYPTETFPQYRPVLEQLLHLKAGGTTIIYFEGNHDFHLGRYFTDTLGADVHTGPAVLSLDGVKTLICHGDEINDRDISYRLMRFVLHGPFIPLLIPVVPPKVAFAIAERLSRRSTGKGAQRKWLHDRRAMIRTFADQWFGKGCAAVVNGHFHLPFQETSEDGTRTLLSVGDWITSFSYGEFVEGEFSLKVFAPPV